jgi:SAM-dependent methyltransferase
MVPERRPTLNTTTESLKERSYDPRRMTVFRNWADQAFRRAMAANIENILGLLEPGSPGTALLDLGCDDGSLTARFGGVVGTENLHGVEVVEHRGQLASARGIKVLTHDLKELLPYDGESFDVVCSNQVIEHLPDTDRFVAETFRVLRPGGYTICSTENLASWHNVAALFLGWQPFSLSNVSMKLSGVGNPLAVHRDEPHHLSSWEHMRVFAYRGLKELYAAHGFRMEAIVGAGYFPLRARLGRREPRHAALLTLKARRP